jgi:pimeloyl-ACP methyl ester carboxylesterase
VADRPGIGVSAVGDRSGGPEIRGVLAAFDGTAETMSAVIETMYPKRWCNDGYVERRLDAARAPAAWQAVAADRLRKLDALEDRAVRFRDCRTFVFDAGGHAPHIQFPDEFNAVALEFLLG